MAPWSAPASSSLPHEMSRCFESGGSSSSITPQRPSKSFLPTRPASRPAAIDTGMKSTLAIRCCVYPSGAEVDHVEPNVDGRPVAAADAAQPHEAALPGVRIDADPASPHESAELARSEVAEQRLIAIEVRRLDDGEERAELDARRGCRSLSVRPGRFGGLGGQGQARRAQRAPDGRARLPLGLGPREGRAAALDLARVIVRPGT